MFSRCCFATTSSARRFGRTIITRKAVSIPRRLVIHGRTAVSRLTSPGKRVHEENRLAVAHYARYLYHPLVLVAPAALLTVETLV